eukprot:CAMPEP_0181477192 /NCGR_PEP_ID=MMETSP1110-20121109/42092_1 /TAXON_ID=174948 /ORGANISM="Symbiodinium sp., Strain CCMP421" /LENGTH=226 /DNA_ID=CAMNT_0023602491 /DNA_START=27 /DNA_END=707 /DNA_ORIENTATION=-
MADSVNGHLNSLQDGVAGAASSFKEGAAHAFDVTGTNQDHPVAEHMGMAANGLIPAGVFTSEDGKGKAMAAGSSADDHTALYAIVGGGVGAALIGAGAFAMMGFKGTSPEKRKVKRGLSNAAAGSQARQVDVEAAAASLQRAAPAMAPMAPQVAAPAMAAPCQYPTEPTAYAPMAYQAEGYQMYQPQAYQAAYQPQGYQMAYQPAAYQQPMTYQAAAAYQPVTYQQ